MPCLSLEAFYNPEWRRRTEGGRERERKGGLFLPRSNSHFAMSVAGLPRFPENAPDKLIIDAPALCIWTFKVMTDKNLIFILKKAHRNRDGEKNERLTSNRRRQGKTRTTFLLFCRNEFYGVAQFPPTSHRRRVCRGGWSPSLPLKQTSNPFDVVVRKRN